MDFHDLHKPDFGDGPQEFVLMRIVLKALENGFDPRGDAFELMQVIKDDLAKVKEERGFSYTKSHISWMLHATVGNMTSKGETASYIVLDRARNMVDHVKHTYQGPWDKPQPNLIVQGQDCKLHETHVSSEDAEWLVYELPEADWDDGDLGIITVRGKCLYGVKRGGPFEPDYPGKWWSMPDLRSDRHC